MAETVSALISGIKPPSMPSYELFAKTGILSVRRNWETEKVDWSVYVRNDRLIPRDHCRQILAEIEVANTPAPKPVAARLVKLLLGAWPSRDLTDAAIFASVLDLTFRSYPGDVGLAAVDALTRASKWLPTRCDLIEALDEAMLPRSYAAHVVEKHLERHEELDREREANERLKQERRARYETEPWLKVIDDWSPWFRPCSGIEYFDWVKQLVGEFGADVVAGWHRDMVNSGAVPKHWFQLRAKLQALAAAARQEKP